MTSRHTSRGLRVVAALAAVIGVVASTPAGATATKQFKAPFAMGPSGGDSWSYHSANSNGTVTVGRVYPIPGVINCTKGGPYAKLIVPVHATRQIKKITVSYTSAALDNFTFALIGLHNKAQRWFGTTTLRGLVEGSGTETLVPDRQTGTFPQVLTIEFGLQQSSACPNADFGTIQYTDVQVQS